MKRIARTRTSRLFASAFSAVLVLIISPTSQAQVEVRVGDSVPVDGVFMTHEELTNLRADMEKLETDLAKAEEEALHQTNLKGACETSLKEKADNFTAELKERGDEIVWKDKEILEWTRRFEESEKYARKMEKRAGGGFWNNRYVTFVSDAIILGAASWAWANTH